MRLIINWVIYAIAIVASAYFLPGIGVDSFTTALFVAVVLGLINVILKPILLILTLPINILTLGLFSLVINALLVMLAANLVPGFRVDDFWWALIFALVLSIINSALSSLVHDKK